VSQRYQVGRGLAGTTRVAGFAVVVGGYLLAGLGAWVVAALLSGRHPLVVTLIADLVATGVVFAVSMAVANASVYDPYWSVAPPVIAIAWAASHPDAVPARQLLVIALITIWAVRLTGHWAGTWRGLAHEDWRYIQLRRDRGGVPWWLVNLGAIQLVPTLVVFAGLLPVWPAVAVGTRPLGVLDVLATLVTLVAIALETVADIQLGRFTRDPANRGEVAEVGLWRYVRHPNYLGEIGLWWGLWLYGLAAAPGWWWTVGGAVEMVALFAFASIPLMDRRSMTRRLGYIDYMDRVPALLPRLGRRGT
jgi:steroid 5-alpha reductase family enzyme